MTDVISAPRAVEASRLEGIQPAIADSTPWSTLKEGVGRTVTISRYLFIDDMPFPVSPEQDSAAVITGKLLDAAAPDNHYSYARVTVATGVNSRGQELRATLPYSTRFGLYDEYSPGGIAVEAYSVRLVPEARAFRRIAGTVLRFLKLSR